LAIPGADLDADSEPIVVDTIDGRALTGYVPYYFLARTRKEIIVNKDVKLIAIKWLKNSCLSLVELALQPTHTGSRRRGAKQSKRSAHRFSKR
jgi:hypothetical protein